MKRLGLILIFVIPCLAALSGQEMEVPLDLQFSLFTKILTFDRNLKERVRDEIVMGIVYQRKFRKSLNVNDELMRLMKERSINEIGNIPIRFISLDIRDETDLSTAISNKDIEILYVAPLRAVNIEAITIVTQAKHILTLTGVPDYVESGLAVGLGTKGGKPLIMINLPGAKAEGADFSSQLLKLAKIIK